MTEALKELITKWRHGVTDGGFMARAAVSVCADELEALLGSPVGERPAESSALAVLSRIVDIYTDSNPQDEDDDWREAFQDARNILASRSPEARPAVVKRGGSDELLGITANESPEARPAPEGWQPISSAPKEPK